ncbi:MAG: STAS domain-containing protein [Deltaproteobacteria bacterium]|nr:STAS domain-containing protein [Deltaproteobacteria bacterium]
MIKDIKIDQEVAVVSLEGSLDVSQQKDFKTQIMNVAEKQEKDIVLDFSSVNFIDSSCLGALVAVTKTLQSAEGDIKLSHLSDDVRSIFQITRLDKIFEIYDDNKQAVEAFYR